MDVLSEGADFVIGSRYVSGGSIPEEWGGLRKLNSLVGNILARYVADLHKIKDCTAGFRAIRANALRTIDLSAPKVKGYALQVPLLHKAVKQGTVVKEVPVDFIDRSHGESKLGIVDIFEFISNIWWIRLQNSKTFFKFLIVGATGVVVNLGSFTLLLSLGINKFLASPVAIELSIISNFVLNNYWRFYDRRTNVHTRIRALRFNSVSILSLGVSYGTFILLSLMFPGSKPQIHQIIGIIPGTLINYFLNSYWTFKHSSSTGFQETTE